KLRKLFERSTDAIFLVDTKTGRYLDANRAAEILTSRSVKEITTLTIHDITPANARERLKTVQQTLKETTDLGQVVYQRPDGTERLVLLSAIPIQDNLVFGLAHDITERVQVEKERELLLAQIRVQALQMQGIIDTVPEGVLLLDADGRVMLANPVAKQDLLTLVGQDIISTHAPITRLGDRSLAELLTSPPAKGLWHETKADDRIFEIIARPMMPAADSRLSTDSQSENWVMVINDVTRERVARGHQHRQERLAAVGQLAAGIAHDFNNMLTVIMLYTHQLTRQEQPSDITVSAAEIIINESKRASKLVGQILDFSRRSSLEISPMDLKPFIKETVRVLERTLPENIRLYLDVGGKEPTTPFIVKGDPTRIQQVLMNLVVNARDAMPQGGDLRIELTCIELRPGDTPPRIEMLPEGLPEGEWICMSVSDTGAGIPPHVMDHIFEPFFSTKGPGEGTGLGLAQVHGIVGAHAGHIGIETELANDGIGGTTFRIYLPSSKGKQDATEEKVSTISQGQGETILLVEDNENLREGGNKLLKSLGYRVLTGANGHEALMLYQSMKGIDLVITDIVMPEMGGKELVIELRKINPDLKVLAVTGYIVDKDMQELRDAGFSNVVYKPFEVDKLAQVIRRTLDEG
ncbi:MAG: response regulator, partial [Chloroflexi bacterium]|nr:response regulator [Chloroflexota bacterium]